jgi:hypothetical protein
MKGTYIAAGVVLAGTILGAFVVATSARGGATQDDAERDQELSDRLANLELEIERTRAGSSHPASRSTPIANPASVEDAEGGRDADQPQGFATNEELQAAYEAAYAEGPERSSWTLSAYESYKPIIEEHLPNTSDVVSFECRADYCRLEAIHDDINSDNEFLMNLFAMEREGPLASTSGGFRSAISTEEPDGRVRHTIFIARPGVPLSIEPRNG